MNTCVVCAEHDKSCPYGWHMAIDCVYLGGRNMMNHAPTAHALPYSTYPFFCEFYLSHLQLSKKIFIFATKSYHYIMLRSLSTLPR